MKFFILIFSVIASFHSVSWAQENYIKLGDAKTQKSLLAFPALTYFGSNPSGEIQDAGVKLFNTITNDLTVSSIFQMMPASSFLEDTTKTSLKPAPGDSKGFKFDSWKTIGAEFLIRGGYSVSGKEVNFEVFVYHVPRATSILGKKYKAPLNDIRKIGHTFANDLIEKLTGSTSMFMSKLVVASNRAGGEAKEIFTMDWDGANIEKLTSHKTIALSPTWSPDGKKIAYTAYVKRTGNLFRNADMFVLDLATMKRLSVSFRKGLNSGANFSPDGKFIYLTISETGTPDIFKISATDGDILARLTKGPSGAMNVEPAVSPDGSKIAFSSDRSGKPMIYVMDIDGKNVKRLTTVGVYNATPAWSPDGKKIAFAGQSEGNFDIFVMDADGSNMIRLTSAKKANGKQAHNEDPCFSPDGRFIVYTSNRTGSNQIFISTVDGTEERRVTADSHDYFKPKWSVNLP